MKHALVSSKFVPATSDAPLTAICPHCKGIVNLRNRQGTYFWRHIQLPRGGCSPQQLSDRAISAAEADDAVAADKHWTRYVGDIVIERHTDEDGGYCLKLRSLSAEKDGKPREMIVLLSEVHMLARAMLDATGTVIEEDNQ